MSSIIAIIATPFGWLLRNIYNLVGNYGVALMLFTVLTKVILMPLSVKQKKSTIRMNIFSPMLQNIQKKYANDPRKQQEKMAELQNDYGFSMTSGCGPMFAQFPILIGLIDVIYKPLRYIVGLGKDTIELMTPVAEGIVGTLSRYSPQTGIISAVKANPGAFSGLASAEQLNFIQNLNLSFLGLDLSQTPSLKVFNALLLVPIISVVLMLLQQILMMKLNGQKMEGPTKFMPFYTGAMFLYFGFIMPAGVSIYWIFSSLFGIAQEYILNLFFDPEKEKAKVEREIAEKRKRKKEMEKQRPARAKKALAEEKRKEAAEDANNTLSDDAKRRLERARAMDREKYGE